jgi:hypothetical protein
LWPGKMRVRNGCVTNWCGCDADRTQAFCSKRTRRARAVRVPSSEVRLWDRVCADDGRAGRLLLKERVEVAIQPVPPVDLQIVDGVCMRGRVAGP